jgi:hypothetical protein
MQHTTSEMMVIAKLMKALNKANMGEDLLFTGSIEVYWADEKMGDLKQFDGGWDYIPTTKGDNDE